MAEEGTLIVFSGPAGTGKDTVLDSFSKRNLTGVWKSISYTTRQPRESEVDGIDYNFISKEKFESLIDNGSMLEFAKYGLNYYGTPKAPVDEHLSKGDIVILKIEVQGASQIRKLYPNVVGVFVFPPSFETLEKRLRGRGSENDEDVRRRLEIAKKELDYSVNYDYHIINDDLEDAVNNLCAIVKAQKLRNK